MDTLTSFASLVAIVAATTQVIKLATPLPKRLLPLFAVALGILVGQSAGFSIDSVVTGLAIGLTAIGAFEVSKRNIIEPAFKVLGK